MFTKAEESGLNNEKVTFRIDLDDNKSVTDEIKEGQDEETKAISDLEKLKIDEYKLK